MQVDQSVNLLSMSCFVSTSSVKRYLCGNFFRVVTSAIANFGNTTISVLLKNVSGYKHHPGSVVAYSAEVAHRVVPIR